MQAADQPSLAESHRLLAVLSLPGADRVRDALGALARLERAGALVILGSMRVERRDDGTFDFARIEPSLSRLGDGGPVDPLARLLQTILDQRARRSTESLTMAGMSDSFLAELGEVMRHAAACVALVVTHVDAGAVVAEFTGSPGTRLVYGNLPLSALESIEELRR